MWWLLGTATALGAHPVGRGCGHGVARKALPTAKSRRTPLCSPPSPSQALAAQKQPALRASLRSPACTRGEGRNVRCYRAPSRSVFSERHHRCVRPRRYLPYSRFHLRLRLRRTRARAWRASGSSPTFCLLWVCAHCITDLASRFASCLADRRCVFGCQDFWVLRVRTMNSSLNHRRVEVAPENEKYTPKPQKQWSVSKSVEYVLREQRFMFVLIGVAIATLFFLFLQPEMRFARTYTDSSLGVGGSEVKESLGRVKGFGNAPYRQQQAAVAGFGGKIPLGLQRKSLRIVVTGGAGFVGSHLVDRLMERGDSVIVVDNFFTGRKENVMHHFGNPRFELIRHDVVEPLLLEVDQIYHLACPASPVHYKFNPIKTIKTNVVGTLNMLGLAKRIGARFLLTSTSEVYGDPLEHPQKETYWGNVNPIGVRSCYDEGKRTAETLAMDYHRGADVPVRIARIFNTYGPRMCIDDGRVVSNFVAQALRKEPMTVYGDGKQTRSFQYVSDLVEGLMRLMEGEHVGPFNLGNPGEFTMLELAEVVKEVIDPSATIEYKENTSDDPHKRKPDISKAKELLGWEPKVALRKGLPLMVEDFRKRIFGDHKDV